MTEGMRVEVDAGALLITFERPERLNALTAEMADRLAAEVEDVAADDHVRAVVLRGDGGAFCSGADVAGLDAHEQLDVRALDRGNRIIRAITGSPKPCLAVVDGVAAGVGCSIALACDLVVASRSASFLLAFARVGLMPDGGASATVAASIGRARAMRMALLGEALQAHEAYDAGLVSHLAGDDFDEVVARLVQQLVAGPPLAHAATKKAVNAATLERLEEALERERSGQGVLLRTADAAEGMRAFSEKRRPVFRGE